MSDVDHRIKELFTLFKLPTLAAECARRFRDAHHDDALDVLRETLEAEFGERRVRRCERLLRASHLPLGKDVRRARPETPPQRHAAASPRARER